MVEEKDYSLTLKAEILKVTERLSKNLVSEVNFQKTNYEAPYFWVPFLVSQKQTPSLYLRPADHAQLRCLIHHSKIPLTFLIAEIFSDRICSANDHYKQTKLAKG